MGRMKSYLYVLAFIAGVFSVSAAGPSYSTPVGDYSTDKGKQLAGRYGASLDRAVAEVTAVYSAQELRLAKLEESAVGGAGFWRNPAKFSTDNRYISMLVIVKKPPFIFGDDRNGHVASVLDRYGKTILSALTKQMEAAPGVDGVALCIIWCDTVSGTPVRAGAEGMALFLAREDVILYKNFKLTIENLVNRNDLFLFNGPKELENFTQFILEA